MRSLNPVGRPPAGPRKTVNIRVPEAMLLELFFHKPQMLSPSGGVKYGALQEYFITLLQQDLEVLRVQGNTNGK